MLIPHAYSKSAASTIDALQGLFLEQGQPLVLKCDNGSALCRGILSYFFHARYNGAAEAGNSTLKTLTHEHAARQGRPGHWTVEDLEAARRMANELRCPCPGCGQESQTDDQKTIRLPHL